MWHQPCSGFAVQPLPDARRAVRRGWVYQHQMPDRILCLHVPVRGRCAVNQLVVIYRAGTRLPSSAGVGWFETRPRNWRIDP